MEVKDTDIRKNFTTMIKNKALDEVKSVKEEWQRIKKTENELDKVTMISRKSVTKSE
jgi:hypothetical protein